MKTKLPLSPISELFKDSLSLLRKNLKKFTLITLSALLPIFLIQLGLEKLLSLTPSMIIAFIAFICVLLIILFSVIQQIALILFTHKISSGTALTVEKTYEISIKEYFLPYLWISALIFAIMSAGLLVIQTIDFIYASIKLFIASPIGNLVLSTIMMAAIIAIVIYFVYLSISFILGYFLMIAQDLRGWKSLKTSKEMMKNKWWKVFLRLMILNLFLLCLSLPNILLSYLPKAISYFTISIYYLLLLTFAFPFTVIYIYNIYKEL